MRFPVAILLITLASLTVLGQGAPTLRIETEVAGLPSELFYGSVKVKPLRLRPGTNTPITIDDSDFFVNQQYVDFLSRFPDQNGLNYWNGQITACGANADCIRISRDNTSGAFFLSIEFQETGYLVERMYKTAYGDATGQSTCCVQGTPSHAISVPIIKRSEFLPDTLQISNGVVVGVGTWQTQLENNKVAFANAFVARARFLTDFPNTMTATEFVNKLNTNAGSPLDSTERTNLINGLTSGMKGTGCQSRCGRFGFGELREKQGVRVDAVSWLFATRPQLGTRLGPYRL